MDAGVQEHRKSLWVGKLLVVFTMPFLVTLDAHADYQLFLPRTNSYLVIESYSGEVRTIEATNHYEACHQFDARYAPNPGAFEYINLGGTAWVCGNVTVQRDMVLVYFLSPICPEHSTRAGAFKTYCLCGSPYVLDPFQRNCVSVGLAITLLGGSEIEPSKGSEINTLPIIANVVDQNTNQPPTTPVNVHISIKVDPTSGGHDHGDSARPRGGVATVNTCPSDGTCWSNPAVNGAMVFNFRAPEASGTHTITATCDGCSNTATKTVNVKVDGLRPIPPSGLYALYESDGSVIGAVQGRHRSNHYLTTNAANRLLALAMNYHHSYPRAPVLHVNDASLMWGGVFDIDTEAEWSTPHEEHMRGTVVDIRANSRLGTIPPENFASFIQLANDRGAHARIHSSGETNQHFHVRLLNRRE